MIRRAVWQADRCGAFPSAVRWRSHPSDVLSSFKTFTGSFYGQNFEAGTRFLEWVYRVCMRHGLTHALPQTPF